MSNAPSKNIMKHNLLLTLLITLTIAMSTSTEAKLSKYMAVQETVLTDTSSLTIEVIEQSSWTSLINKSQDIISEEDKYLEMIINGIHPRSAGAYTSESYVHYGVGGIRLEDIDCPRFVNKVQKVIDIYNKYHYLQLTKDEKILNEYYMQVDICSTNLKYLESPVEYIGQFSKLRLENTLVWNIEDCDKYWILSQSEHSSNVVKVDGVCYLDDSGNIINSSFEEFEQIELGEKRLLHIISSDGTSLGWVDPTDVIGF